MYESSDGKTRYVLGPAILSGSGFASATKDFTTGASGQQAWGIDYRVPPSLTSAYEKSTSVPAKKKAMLAFSEDGKVVAVDAITAPVKVQGIMADAFSADRAQMIAVTITSGQLPVPLTVVGG